MSVIERNEDETIGDDGYRRIRTDILLARLAPGQRLKLEMLREAYGVSISTLREILNRPVNAVLMTGDTSTAMREVPLDTNVRVASKPIKADELLGLIKALLIH